MNRGKPNWEHLNEELHVLITVEDTENRAKVKLSRAVEEVRKLLVPSVGMRSRIEQLFYFVSYFLRISNLFLRMLHGDGIFSISQLKRHKQITSSLALFKITTKRKF